MKCAFGVFAVLAICSLGLSAQDKIYDDHIIIIVGEEKKKDDVKTIIVGEPVPRTADEIYAPIFTNPAQTWTDTDVGPLPLYTDLEYDAQGNPRPRIPDYFTKQLIDNPTEENAIIYLAQNRSRWRKYKQASVVLQSTAAKIGYVTPEMMPVQEIPAENNRSIFHMQRDGWQKQDQGTPVMTDEQARASGIAKADIPLTPGVRNAAPVEVILVWDWRDPYSQKAIPSFMRWGKELNDKEMGPRFLTMSVDNDGKMLQQRLDFIDYVADRASLGVENWTDTTNFIDDMRITVTPTYCFFDRRSGRIRRLEGYQNLEALRNTLMDLVNKKPEDYERMDPTWFREAEVAFGSHRQVAPSDAPPIPNSTPIKSATRTVAPWMPGTGWIRPDADKKAPVKE